MQGEAGNAMSARAEGIYDGKSQIHWSLAQIANISIDWTSLKVILVDFWRAELSNFSDLQWNDQSSEVQSMVLYIDE